MIRFTIITTLVLFRTIAHGELINSPGRYPNQTKKCIASISTSEMGGFKILEIIKNESNTTIAKDLTGAIWIDKNQLIYTTSPIYSAPGIFLYNCEIGSSKSIVKSQHKSKEYPNGSDYFEIQKYEERSNLIFLFYSSDIDNTNFNHFRNSNHLFQVNINGNDFKQLNTKQN